MQQSKRGDGMYVRNIIFGIEDSLAATVGLLSGIAAEGIPKETLLLAGFVYIFVEAFSMGVGSFLSEESTREYEGRPDAGYRTVRASIAMFVSCVLAGAVPLLPYLALPYGTALLASIAISLVVLGVLGFVQAKLAHRPLLPRIVRMILLGGLAIVVGVVVGKVFTLA